MADLTGRRLGKYELVERLGRGGMAEVYKAYQPGMDRFVAVKVMHSHLAETDDFVSRFKREAQLVGQLRHPHIVQVIDFDVEDDIYYMVMEFIKGETLKYYIQQKGAVPADEALRIASRLADALSYAHQQNMIHRDIKPANVMFTDLTFTHPVLTDFGIARIISGETQLTASGAFVGTPAYISPESARGEPVDERADIYSMGIMLYEMIAGKVPYDADTPFAVIMKHVNDPLPSPRQFNIRVTDSVERVLFTALAKNPAERYQSAADLRDALNDALDALATERPTQQSTENRTPEDLEATLATGPDQDAMPTVTYGTSTTSGHTATANRMPQIVGAVVLLAILAGATIFGLGLLDSDEGDNNSGGNSVVETEDTDSFPTDASLVDVLPAEDVATADTQLELGNYSEAITAYTVLLGDFPEEASLLQKRGQAFYEIGEYDNALEDIDAAVNLDEALDGIFRDRGAVYVELGDFEDALEDLNLAVESDSENPELYLLRARTYYGLDQDQLALDDVTRAIDIDTAYAQAYAVRGEIYLSSDDTANATDDFNRAILLDPGNAEARVGRARLFADSGNYETAITELNLALEANPQFAEAYADRGFVYLALEEYSSALSDFNSAIRNDDSLANAFMGRGLIQFQLSNYDEAIEDLSVAIEEMPTAEVYLRRAQAYLEEGNDEAALADFESAVDLDEDLIQAHLGVARLQEENGNSDEAAAAYSEVLELDPENLESLLSRAWLYSDDEQYDDARVDFEAYIALDDQEAEAFLGLGDSYLVAEDFELAIENYDRALELDETSAYAYLNRGYAHSALEAYEAAVSDFTEALANGVPDKTEAYYERGFAHKALGNDEDAIEDFSQALSNDSELPELYVARGQAYTNVGDYEAALADFETALENGYGDDSEIRRYRAIAYAETDNYEAALDDLNSVLNEEPTDLQMLYYTAVSNIALENYDDAVDTLTDVIERNFDNLGDAYLQRGIAYLATGEAEAALRDFTQAIQQNAELAEAHYQRGLANRELNNDEDAIADFTHALELDDTFAAAYYYRGEIYLNQDDYDLAIADFDLAIEHEFDEIYKAYLDRGFAYSNNGNPDEAIRSYTQAIDEKPDYARAFNNRGIVYFDHGDYERAIENFDQAIELDHFDLAAVYYNRGLSKYNLNDLEGSIEDFNESLEIDDAYARAYYARGNSYFDLEEFDAAIDDFNGAIENDYSPLEFAYINRGLSASANEDYEAAIADYTRAIEINDSDALAFNNRAVAYLEMEEFESAVTDYERALALNYDAIHWVYHGLARAQLGLGNTDVALDYANQALDALPGFADALRLRAGIHVELGNLTNALTDYNELIANGDGEAEDYYQRGQLLFMESDYDAAVNDLDRAILLDADLVDAYVLRASSNLELGNPEAAKADLERALQFGNDSAEVFETLGDIYFDDGELEVALENYDAYVELVGTNASLRVLNRIGQIEDALSPESAPPSEDDQTTIDEPDDTLPATADAEIAQIGYAFAIDSDSLAVISRERNLREVADNEGVEVALQELNAMDIDTAALLALRGEFNIYTGNSVQGLADADAAIEQDPNHPAGHLVRALYFSVVEFNEDEILVSANRAVEVAPDNGLVRLVYGNILRNLGRYEDAIVAYNQAEALGAPIQNVLLERSVAFEEMGDHQGVVDNLAAFIQAQPENFPYERLRLARAHLLLNEPDAAFETVETQIRYGDEDPSYYAQAAYVAYRVGNLDQARTWARNALALSDDIPAANYVLALVATREEDFGLAAEQFDIVGSFDDETWRYEYPFLNPSLGHHVIVDQARLIARQGDIQNAITLLTEAIDTNYMYESLLYQVRGEFYLQENRNEIAVNDFIMASSLTDEPVRVRSILDIVQSQGEDYIFEVALSMFDRFELETIPELIEGQEEPRFEWLRGRLLIENNQPGQARDLAETMIESDPQNPFGHLLLSSFHLEQNNTDAFNESVQQAFEVGADEPYVVLEAARALRNQGENDRAVDLYYQAGELGVSPYRLLPERAIFLYETGRFENAIEDFQRFGELPDITPEQEVVYIWAGSHILMEQPENALQVVERYVEIPVPEWAQAEYYASLAYIAYRAEANDLTTALIERAKEVDAGEPHARYLRALIATRDEDFETALAIFGELRRVESWRYEFPFLNSQYGHMLLLDEARVFLRLENYEEALPRLSEAIEQHGGFIELYLTRADVYLALDNPDAAIEDLRSAFERSDDEELRAAIRDRLTELTGGE
jgi:tetratricopeptide (TPR) repeat protein/tRNA A-37 threonylcarbamoyl transferase component Bud32